MAIDWIEVLKPSRAVGNLRVETTGDWYRDPWGWPEFSFLIDGHLDWLESHARSSQRTRRVVKLDVPKENFGMRPAVVIEPLDRVLYQGLVDAASKKLIGDLERWVHGWRLKRVRVEPGVYSPNDREWRLYRDHLRFASLICDFGLKSDIVSCFASIPIDRLCEEVERKNGRGDVTKRLVSMLESFDRIPGRSGLPQRSIASAVLANMYLNRLRHVMEDYASSDPILAQMAGGTLILRWMDDIWAFGDDDALLRGLQIDLQSAAREAGLEIHAGKTDLLAEEDLWDCVYEMEHSGVDASIDEDPPDLEPLEHLIDKIVDSPEGADRTTIRFAMTRMRRQRLDSRLPKLIDIAPRMPQGADHIARAFRDFGMWESLQDWYVEYADGPWGKISWSVAQMGTMFPAKRLPSSVLIDKFGALLSSRADFPLLALAAQRLAAWKPNLARDLLHDLVEVADHPQERRVIALAAATVGQEKRFIRKILGEYEENALTLSILEERSFRPLNPAPDFGAEDAE